MSVPINRPALAFAVLAAVASCAATTSAAQHQHRLPAYLLYVESALPTWRLIVPADSFEKQVGVLREGDVVSFELEDTKSTLIARWVQRYRYFSHKKCRGFLFFKKCTRHFAISPCPIEHHQDPVDGALRITITLVPDGARNTVRDDDKVVLGNGRRSATKRLSGPRRLRVTGAFEMPAPVCTNPRGKKHGDLNREYVLGDGAPQEWFTLQVTIDSPELDR